MTALAALVADIQARGVTLEPRGEKLAIRPVSRLTREDLIFLAGARERAKRPPDEIPQQPPTTPPAGSPDGT